MANINNPWLGLKTYAEGQVLYGRSDEIHSLSQDIIFNKQTILYGKSGIGKSSLLNAGIFPLLRRAMMFPVNIRLIHDDENTTYFEQIKRGIKESIGNLRRYHIGADGKNRIVDNLSGCIEEICPLKTTGKEETLWEYFHRHRFYNDTGEDIQPVIVFDQFEEIFTLCRNEEARTLFFDQLADLINNIPPAYIYDSSPQIEQSADMAHLIDEEYVYENNDLVLIEDDDTCNHTNQYLSDPQFHVVITLREEYLSHLERSTGHIPLLKHNRFCLRPLSDDQAGRVITEPIPDLISKEVATEIISKVTNVPSHKIILDDGKTQTEVDSAILSLFLSELYERKVKENIDISIELVKQIGDNIISSFYERTIKQISTFTIEYLEHRLVTEDGIRDSIFESRALRKGVRQEELDYLKEQRLIHEFPWNDNGIRIEFMHDILCPVIKERKEKRKTNEKLKEYEIEQKRLKEEKEEQRTLRNREYNRQKKSNILNVLTPKGRRLLDNSLDFGEYLTFQKYSINNEVDRILFLQNLFRSISEEFFKDKDSELETSKTFDDPSLGNATIRMAFIKNGKNICTIDGVYALSVNYTNKNISEIWFFGNRVDGTIDYSKPIYIYGGYCGIHIDYDDNNREIRRTFLGDDGNPIQCIDGYAILENELDTNGNSIRTRYYKCENGKILPCAHIHGNFGFNSIYDKSYNEIERVFIDENGNPTEILSGVCGKRMKYDPENFQITELSNIDNIGAITTDFDGYATVRFKYDYKNRQCCESYYDVNGNKWSNPNNVHEITSEYDSENLIARQYNHDENGELINGKDGICYNNIYFNKEQQVIRFLSYNKDGDIVSDEDNIAEQQYDYDKLYRLNQVKFLDSFGTFSHGFILDLNKEGSKALRFWPIDANGEIILNQDYGDEEHPVYAIEFDDEDSNIPILHRFVNKNLQFIACSDGYYALRKWKDERNRVYKEIFYDNYRNKMCDSSGVYGHLFEYLNDNETKIINIDINDIPIEDNDGVCYNIITNRKDFESQFLYDINGNPSMKKGYFGYSKETIHIGGSNQRITKLLDDSYNPIKGQYFEEILDKENRVVQSCYKNIDNELVKDVNGAYLTLKNYSSDGLAITTIYADDMGNPCDTVDGYCKIVESIDTLGRNQTFFIYDVNNNPIQLNDGSFGYMYEYESDRTKTTIYIGKEGIPANNSDGIAYKVEKFDDKGRLTLQKQYDLNKELVGGCYGVRSFVNSNDRYCAYYLHWLDSDDNLVPTDDNCFYKYQEQDAYGRIIKELYYGKDMEPICDGNGDFGLVICYDNQDNKRIYSCLNKEGMPHNNSKGYSSIERWYDAENRVIKELYYTIEHNPCVTACGSYGFTYQYLDNGAQITGFLNEYGDIDKNNEGYAYKEELKLSEGGLEYYYDIYKRNTISLADDLQDYGKRFIKEKDELLIISLDECGNPHINKKGYVASKRVMSDDGTVFSSFIDMKNNLIADDFGDYATAYESNSNGAWNKEISLNRKWELHNNLYGYAYAIKTYDIIGNEIRLWYNKHGKQVIPQKTFKGVVYSFFRKIKENIKSRRTGIFAFNPRQIGAQHSLILVRQEQGGLAKKNGLRGTYILLRIEHWDMYDDIAGLEEIIRNIPYNSKKLILQSIEFDGNNIKSFGDIFELSLPKGKLGFRFVDWKVNKETYNDISNIFDLYTQRVK